MTNAELQACESIKGIHREMKKANEPNWEQRRYEIAKDCLVGMLGNSALVTDVMMDGEPIWATPVPITSVAVKFADLLIHELRTKEDDKNEKKD